MLCARGGYGILRILDRLDADALRRDPKPIVGFSDATALLFWALRAAGLRSIHGPVVAQLNDLPAEDTAWLVERLEGRVPGALATGLHRTGADGDGRIEGRWSAATWRCWPTLPARRTRSTCAARCCSSRTWASGPTPSIAT